MKSKKIIILFLSVIIFLSLKLYISKNNYKNENIKENIKETKKELNIEDRVDNKEIIDKELEMENKLEKYNLDEKIGQLIISGFNGYEFSEEVRNILELNIGGLIYFDRNIKNRDQLSTLNKSIYNYCDKNNIITPFLSIDEEGGLVSRLKKLSYKTLNMSELGDVDNEELSYLYGQTIANRLKTYGFNINYAPVLDINSNINNPVIGVRAFGDNKDIVTRQGIKVAKGLKDNKVIPVIKHFPGHGDTDIDSHKDIPLVKKEYKEIEKLELYPFITAIEEDIPGIMVGHLLYDSLDNKKIASQSDIIINDILISKLSYNNLIFSDDLTMGAVGVDINEAVFRFIKSGGDIALVCHINTSKDLEEIIQYIKDKVDNEELLEEEIDKKVLKILKFKEKYKIEKFETNENEDEFWNLYKEVNK